MRKIFGRLDVGLNLLRGNFALLILCFFMPWLELRCDNVSVKGRNHGQRIVSQTGMQVAYGGYTDTFRNPFGEGNRNNANANGDDSMKPPAASPKMAIYGAALLVGMIGSLLARKLAFAWEAIAVATTTAACTLSLQFAIGFPLAASASDATFSWPATIQVDPYGSIIEINLGFAFCLYAATALTALGVIVAAWGIWSRSRVAAIAMLALSATASGIAISRVHASRAREFESGVSQAVLGEAMLNDPDPGRRREAAARLIAYYQIWLPNSGWQREITKEEQAETLRLWRKLPDDPHPALRIFGLAILSKFGGDDVDFAIRALSDPDETVAEQAFHVIHYRPGGDIENDLSKKIAGKVTLDHPNARVRVFAARRMLANGHQTNPNADQVVRAVREIFQGRFGDDKIARMFGGKNGGFPISRYRPVFLQECIPWLTHADPIVRKEALQCLPDLPNDWSNSLAEKLAPAIRRLLSDEDPEIRKSHLVHNAAIAVQRAGVKIDDDE